MGNQKIITNSLLQEQLSYAELTGPFLKKPLDSPKILILSWADSGGAGVAAYRIFKALKSYGANVSMMVMFKETNDPEVLVLPIDYSGVIDSSLATFNRTKHAIANNFERWRDIQRNHPSRSREISFYTDPFAETELYNIKEICDADVINIHWVAGLVDYPKMAESFGGKPLFWTLHDMNPFTGGCHYTNGCVKYQTSCGNCPMLNSGNENDISRIYYTLKKSAIQNRNLHICTPSRWLGNESHGSAMLGHFPHSVVHNTLPTNVFTPPSDQKTIRRSLGIPEDAFVVLTGAAVLDDVRKGFRFVPEMFQLLINEKFNRPVVLALYGKGDIEIPMPKEFPVISLGYIDGDQKMANIYSAADLFMITSLEDNLPNVVIESMACGTPVLGFDTGGIPDMIQHKKTGYLVKQKDLTGLADGLRWAIDEGDSFNKIRANCRDWIMKTFSNPIIAGQYHELFTSAWSKRTEARTLIGSIPVGTTDSKYRQNIENAITIDGFDAQVAVAAISYFAQIKDEQSLQDTIFKALAINPLDRDTLLVTGSHIAVEKLPHWLRCASTYIDIDPAESIVLKQFIGNQERYATQLLSSAEIHCEVSEQVPAISVCCIYNDSINLLEETLVALAENTPDLLVEVILLPSDPLHYEPIEMPEEWQNLLITQIILPANLTDAERFTCGVVQAKAPIVQFLWAGQITIEYAMQLSDMESNSLDIGYGDIAVTPQLAVDIDRTVRQENGLNILRTGVTDFNALRGLWGIGSMALISKSVFTSAGYPDSSVGNEWQQLLYLRATQRSIKIGYFNNVVGQVSEECNDIPAKVDQYTSLKKRFFNRTKVNGSDQQLRIQNITKYLLNEQEPIVPILRDVTGLLEQGKSEEALNLFDQISGGLLNPAVHGKIISLIDGIRTKISFSK